MKKIKFLHGFVIVLIIAFIINYLTNIYLSIYPPNFMAFSDEHYDKFIFGHYTQFVGMVISIFTFIALFYIERGLFTTLKNGFFNKISATKFKVASVLFLISGFLSMFWDVTLLIYSNGEPFFLPRTISDILLVLIGFTLLIISDFITNGNVLQQENNLTI